MSPGTYLRLRREAAGVSVDVAAQIVAGEGQRKPAPPYGRRRMFAVRTWIALVESDAHLPSPPFADLLRTAFAFDRFILRQLITGIGPVELCRVCGCSALDACEDAHGAPCAWATPSHDLCTRCAVAGAQPEESVMPDLFNWTARRSGGRITITATDASGRGVIVPGITEIKGGVLGRRDAVAMTDDGTDYRLISDFAPADREKNNA